MSWYGLALRGAGNILFGVMAGWELKDIIPHALGSTSGSSGTPSGGGSSSETLSVVAVISQDINMWAHLGRVVGITLAIFEVGKLLAAHAVSYEAKTHHVQFRLLRGRAYKEVLYRSGSKLKGLQLLQEEEKGQAEKTEGKH